MSHSRLEASRPERPRPRHAFQAKGLDSAQLENQVARVVPRLSGLNDDFDGIEAVQIDKLLFFAGQTAQHHDPPICQQVSRADSREHPQEKQRQGDRNRKQCQQIAQAENVNIGPANGKTLPQCAPQAIGGDGRPDRHDRRFLDVARRNPGNRLGGHGQGGGRHRKQVKRGRRNIARNQR
jgi:hypothetical protein